MDIPSDSIPRHTSGVGVESDGGFPGFDSVGVIGFLTGFDPSGLDDDGLLQVMVEAQRVVAAAQAVQVKAMAELARRRPRTLGHPFGEFVADEIAVELCLTRRAAENLLGQAVELTTRTPAVLHALETGALDLYRASAITDATYRLDQATATQVATDVMARVERRNIRARDGKCRFPSCPRSARHADLDHTIPWPKGPTTAGNLGALCRKHHRLKHQTTWRLTQNNGQFCWTSPTGRHYVTEPENHDPP